MSTLCETTAARRRKCNGRAIVIDAVAAFAALNERFERPPFLFQSRV